MTKVSVTPTCGNQFLWTVSPRSTHPAVQSLLPFGTEASEEKAHKAAQDYVNAVARAKSMPILRKER